MKKLNLLNGMRICIFSSWYPYSENPLYGIFVHQFAKRIHKAGADVFVIATTKSNQNKEFEKMDDIPIFRIGSCFSVFCNPHKLLILYKIFRRADIVNIHAIDFFGAILTLIAKLMKKPVVITVQRAEVLSTNSLLFNLLRTIALKIANVIIAVSYATKNLAVKAGAPENKVVVVYNAAEESIFFPRPKPLCRVKLGIPQNSKVVLSVGGLIPRKGFISLIRAMPLILNKIPDALMIIVGDGPEKSLLSYLVRSLKLEGKVIFTGRIFPDDLCLYYGAADVFVLPSLHEGHALVLLEAMASGLSVVATRVSGNVETVLHSKNGYLVQPKDVNQLAKAVINILVDENRIRKFGDESVRIYKEKFSEEKQICKIAKIYSTVTSYRMRTLQVTSI